MSVLSINSILAVVGIGIVDDGDDELLDVDWVNVVDDGESVDLVDGVGNVVVVVADLSQQLAGFQISHVLLPLIYLYLS